jgi:hypothetical protein
MCDRNAHVETAYLVVTLRRRGLADQVWMERNRGECGHYRCTAGVAALAVMGAKCTQAAAGRITTFHQHRTASSTSQDIEIDGHSPRSSCARAWGAWLKRIVPTAYQRV